MEVRNCRRCGEMFVYVGRDICPHCREEDERDFDRVREYLRQYPRADIQELHRETGVEKEKILGFLREGRLEVDKDSARSVLNCRICGTPISRGRICMDCLQKFKQSQAGGAERELDYENRLPGSSSKNSRMYIKDIWAKKGRNYDRRSKFGEE